MSALEVRTGISPLPLGEIGQLRLIAIGPVRGYQGSLALVADPLTVLSPRERGQ